MIDGCQRGKFRHSGDNGVIDFLVLLQARAGGEEGGESMCCSLLLYFILRCLFQADEGAYGHGFFPIARCLSAPRRTENSGLLAEAVHMYYRIVIVQ